MDTPKPPEHTFSVLFDHVCKGSAMPSTLAHTTTSTTDAVSRPSAVPALLAVLFGVFLFIAAGFAGPTVLHNATHDTRHALGLPCH